MDKNRKILAGLLVTIVVVVAFVFLINPNSIPSIEVSQEFPDFFTANEDYYITRIGDVPTIDRETYRLEIKGLIDNPTDFSLAELQSLNLTQLPLTIECIGNTLYISLLATANWTGFNVYDLLDSLGIGENATGVRYMAADGYYASHTMEQLRDNGVLGALYMNGVEIPPVQGFPLRILNPGYFGVKQPAWVTEIEVIDRPLEDYWQDRSWDTSPPMEIDSKIFFPTNPVYLNVSQPVTIGGCAYGGTRVQGVEYTINNGGTWNPATIVQQIDADNVWVFWQIDTAFSSSGAYTLHVRATDIFGNTQSQFDYTYLNGTSEWPWIHINVL
ncbi:MAG: molybdopterin-dependent oxidoreductase [Candidatus Thorarchaeota archaeon]